jgi:hypothetical protein
VNREELIARLRSSLDDPLPLPGSGNTCLRHRRLMAIGREDLSLARLAEAHWDAVAILAEYGRQIEHNAIYGVWASEIPGRALELADNDGGYLLSGTKPFCTGGGLIDRALVTVGLPDHRLVDVDLRNGASQIRFDDSGWKTAAFTETKTTTVTFNAVPVSEADMIGGAGWYLSRPGFWHGACGPAACWAGGAAGLVDYAYRQNRDDPHTLAHLGALHALNWALTSYLDTAGREIDTTFSDGFLAEKRALTLRHLVEQACTEIIRRLPRAYGPYPIAMDEEISRRYSELDLYLRQSHAERDLESLGRKLRPVDLKR